LIGIFLLIFLFGFIEGRAGFHKLIIRATEIESEVLEQ